MNVEAIDWNAVSESLDAYGCAQASGILLPAECQAIAGLYPDDSCFRSRVVMARHGFGRGEYKYLRHPLPALVSQLREQLYPPLADIANRWNAALKSDVRFPDTHAQFLRRCHQAGQTRPTPLVLRYTEGDYNCLHQDLYGEHVFPLQAAFLLSNPGEEFTGGEFLL